MAQTCNQDAFEPNDDCDQAMSIPIGTTTGLVNGDQETDNYRVLIPAGQLVEVRLRPLNPSSSVSGFFSLLELDSLTCNNQFAFGVGSGSYFHAQTSDVVLGWSTPHGEALEFNVNLFTFGDPAACMEYELDVTITPSECTPLETDVFAANHSCETAAAVGLGSYTGLRASVSERDYYAVQVSPDSVGLVELTDIATQGQVYVWVYESSKGCVESEHVAATLIWADSGGVYIPNATGAQKSYVVEVEARPDANSQAAFCLDYSLHFSEQASPCGGLQGDRFEPNDTLALATPITQTELGLTSAVTDSDYFTIEVPARGTLTVTRIGELFPDGMALYSENQEHWLQGGIFIGTDANDPRHRIQWTNDSPSPRSTVLSVRGNRPFPGPFCGNYDLELEITFGNSFCAPASNSTGEPARLKATGSLIVGEGTLSLTTAPTPAGQFGLTFFGQGLQNPAPMGSGSLCISGLLRRMPIADLAGDGLLTTIDWDQPGVSGIIQAGTTWEFQTWYRDNGGASNVSEGLQLTFQ